MLLQLQYLLLCLLLCTYPLQLFVVLVKFCTFIFTHFLSHELGEEKERKEGRGGVEKGRGEGGEGGREGGKKRGKEGRRKEGREE